MRQSKKVFFIPESPVLRVLLNKHADRSTLDQATKGTVAEL